MSGTNRRVIVIQDRDRHLLRELATMRVVDREQAGTVCGFGSITRVNSRLLALTDSGLLRRFFLGTTVGGRKGLYGLSPRGAEVVGVPLRGPRRRKDETLAADFFVKHQLTINEVYCALKYGPLPAGVSFIRWVPFYEPLVPGLRLIPDGYFELGTPSGTLAAFVEVDLGHESLRVWQEKVRNYLQFALSGDCERRFGQTRFRVLVLVNSLRRLHSIRKAVAAVTEKLFWLAMLESVPGAGFFSPVWFRPAVGEPQALIQETP